jgi:TrmH family RNA methyltransferase
VGPDRTTRNPAAAVSSRRHPLVERCRRLARGLDAEHLLLDGPHLLAVALDGAWPVEVVLAHATPGEAGGEVTSLVERARARGIEVVTVTASVLDAASPVRAPSPVVAIARRRDVPVAAVLVPPPALVVVACDVQDPGNVGAIVRAADACGATGVVAAGASADPFGWKALRGAMGSALRVPACRAPDTGGLVRTLREAGLTIVAASGRGGMGPSDVDWRCPVALLVGNEGAGLDTSLASLTHVAVSIPMRAGVDSLNVAVAAGILLFQAREQRRTQRS